MATERRRKKQELIDSGVNRAELEEVGRLDPDKILEYRRRLSRSNDESKGDEKSEEADDAV